MSSGVWLSAEKCQRKFNKNKRKCHTKQLTGNVFVKKICLDWGGGKA